MFLSTTVLILLLCGGLQAEELIEAEPKDDGLTEQLKYILACIKPKLIAGLPDLGVPPLDPLEVVELSLDNLGGGFVYLNSIIVKGISDLDASNVDLVTSMCDGGFCMDVSVELLLPSISLTTDYDADVTLFDTLRVYGNGNISLTIEDVAPSLNLTISLSTVSISDLNVNLEVGEVDFKATGLLNDDYMSTLISNMIKSIIKDHLNDIVQNVVALLTSAIENGEEIGSIDTDKLFAILEELLTGCLGVDDYMEALKMEALLRRR